MITLAELGVENTPFTDTVSYSEGYPQGVPHGYSWYRGDDNMGLDAPPQDFSAVEGWSVIYNEEGSPVDHNAAADVQVANAQTWVHVTASDQWVQVQSEAGGLTGAHFINDFQAGDTLDMPATTLADGSISFDAPPDTLHNDHFWFASGRGEYAPGAIDGVYVQMDMRVTDPDAHLVAQLGADWWRDQAAPYNPDFSNNPTAGEANWVDLTTQWETHGFTSMEVDYFTAHVSNLSSLFADAPPPPPPPTPDPTPPPVHDHGHHHHRK